MKPRLFNVLTFTDPLVRGAPAGHQCPARDDLAFLDTVWALHYVLINGSSAESVGVVMRVGAWGGWGGYRGPVS
jgi:hypothetical protein